MMLEMKKYPKEARNLERNDSSNDQQNTEPDAAMAAVNKLRATVAKEASNPNTQHNSYVGRFTGPGLGFFRN